MSFKRILVPVDGSSASLRGLETALQLAQAVGGQLLVIHVLEPAPMPVTPEAAVYTPDLVDDLRGAGQSVLDAAAARANEAAVSCVTALVDVTGKPVADMIVAEAKRLDADVIALGTHGRSGLRRVLMGSSAEGVVRQAEIPVLLVRAPSG